MQASVAGTCTYAIVAAAETAPGDKARVGPALLLVGPKSPNLVSTLMNLSSRSQIVADRTSKQGTPGDFRVISVTLRDDYR